MARQSDRHRETDVRRPGRRPAAAGYRRLRPRLEPLEDRKLLAVDAIVAENQLPGTPPSQWQIFGGGDTTIQGFSTDISVDHGQTASFKINDPAKAPYHIDIYRMGYYQGNGARLVTTIPSSQTLDQVQPSPLTNTTTGLVDAGNWAVSASWAVPASATSGIYFANVKREDTGGTSQIYFIVRNDEGSSAILFQTSDSTWQAYNTWGGTSLYQGGSYNSGGGVAVSYNRPITLDATGGGFGDYNSPWHAEYPMVRWLEANGYDVSYFTDVDSARNGNLILNHQVFMSVGHDEYWSAEQRANVVAARDAGVNLAFFSGNESFWKTRWQNSTDGSNTPYRTIVCYKESKNGLIDPLDSSPTWTWTGTWRDVNGGPPADGGIPENAMSGTIYMADRTSVDLGISMNVPAADANLRFWRNTSVAKLAPGQVATLGQYVVGYEVDSDPDNGFRPAGLIDMSSTTFSTQSAVQDQSGTQVGPGTVTHSITLYRAPSGALVFGAGTVQWSWGLDGNHNDTPSTPDPAMQQATVNLLADMNVEPATLQPGLDWATASTDVTPPTSTITAPAAGAPVTVGSTVTVTGTATDAGGGGVAGVAVSTDGGQTWHPATPDPSAGWAKWSYTWVPDTPGPIKLESRAVDDSGNIEHPSGITVSVSYQPTSTTGLVAAYGFNEGSGTTVADASGHGNTGTISGATWAPGLYGQALSFNGTNSWVTINDSSSLNLTSGMTLEAWVEPTAPASNWTAVMLKERSGGLDYSLYAADGANQPPAVYMDHSSNDSEVRGTSNLPLNTWSFLTGTYDGSNLRLYVNGTLVNTVGASGLITTSTDPLRIGGDAVWGEYFQGLIDNIRVYNRPLNQGEIRGDMSTPVGSTQVENTPPAGSITGPTNNATVSGVTTVTANASDNVLVAGVQFQLNGANLGPKITAAPYSFSWNTRTIPNGTYTLSAVVSDMAGNTTQLTGVSVAVSNPADTTPPTVRLTNPTGSPLVSGTIVPSAYASDNIGVVGVQFQLNGANLGSEVTAAPYRFAWDTTRVADGTYTLTAVARDAAGNRTASSPVSVKVDNTPPQVTVETPAPGATGVSTTAPHITAAFSEPVQSGTIGFVLKDSAGNALPASVAYDPSTNTATFTPGGALEPSTTYTAAVSGALDLARNPMAPASWSFTTTSTVVNATLWGSTATPAVASANDFSAQELGVKFTSDIAGYITGVRFYKGSGNTGTHVGHLWTSAGALLASATFTGETASGWQQVTFAQPVAVAAGTTYVASYYAPNGGYAYDSAYFANSGVDAGVLHAPSSAAAGGNGVYGAPGTFPAITYNATNYWVDVVFSNVLVPAVIGTTPAANATGVSTTSPNITVTFSKPVQPSTISFTLTDSNNNPVASTLAYNPSTSTATLMPSVALAALKTFTAMVSGAQDTAGNTMTPVSWSFTTAAPDTTPPTITAMAPASGATLVSLVPGVTATFSEPVQSSTVSFTLADSTGHLVASTLAYNPSTNTETLTPSAPLAVSATYTATVQGAQDLAGNTMAPVSWSFTTAPKITNATLWGSTATPAVPAANDSAAYELGVKFTSDTGGYITGLRFYKGPGNTGAHVGHLWTSAGALLATATFANETASGWQQVTFDQPVAVAANTTYVASYYAPNGHYAYSGAYFASSGVDAGVLHAPAGGNGVYTVGSDTFPASTYNATNYWVDVVFSNVPVPTVIDTTPAANATGVSTATAVTADFNEAVQAGTVSFTLKDPSGNPVAATVSVTPSPGDDSATSTVILTPHSPLAPLTTYTATVSGAVDTAGTPMAGPVTWSFTTAIGGSYTNATIWSSTATPAVASASDSSAQELGVKFTSDLAGYITGLRFYKGSGNTGTHVGHLWTSTGTLLATATFANETASGWQQVTFDQPVAVAANTTYVASYYAPNGGYAYSGAYFASAGADNPPLHALASGAAGGNGVYTVGSDSFPASTYNATNYWVDVVFNTNLTPTVTSTTPAANATGVGTSSPVVINFSEKMSTSTINSSTFYLQAAGTSTAVPATVTYSGLTATLQPSAPLALNTTYQVTVSGTITDTFGNPLGSAVTWSFTTQQYPSFTDTTVADFGAGTPDANTAIGQTGDGAVILKPAEDAEFSGPALPADWTSTPLATGGTATVSGGLLTVDGDLAGTSALYAPGRSLEFTATFSGDPYQHIGLGTDLSAAPWAIFSTGSGGALYARTNSGSGSTDTLIPGNWLGSPHDFRIDWTATGVTYSIDGTQVASHPIAITASMRPLVDDNNAGGGTVTVSWMRLTPYAASGTYLSRVFDAGGPVTWVSTSWADVLPSGTSLVLSVRMGNTPTPDGSWTDFVPLSGPGATIGGVSRYSQYRAVLATTDPGQTPVLQSVTVNYTTAPDAVAPRVVSESPAPNATGVGLLSPVVVKLSELMNAATIGTSTVYLQAAGSSTAVPATVTYSGSTIILQPSVALTGNTTYQVVVSGSITDSSGNPLGSPVTWSFTTGVGQWQQSTLSDFSGGTPSGTMVTDSAGGEVQLASSLSDDFDGSTLSASWASTSWASAGGGPASVTLSGGVLSVAGAEVLSAPVVSGAPVEGRINFGATPYQYFGLATDLGSAAGNSWAAFSTGGTSTTLFARVNVSGATQDVSLGALPAGFHVYRVQPVSGGFQFSVDGVLQTTVTATIPGGTPLKAALSAFSGSPQPALQADWVRVDSYPSSGTFTSSTFDAGRTATWGTASWTAIVPAGTTLVVETSSSTDGVTWTPWSAVSNGGAIASPAGRYLRYRVTLTTTDPTLTPVLDDITFTWN